MRVVHISLVCAVFYMYIIQRSVSYTYSVWGSVLFVTATVYQLCVPGCAYHIKKFGLFGSHTS